MKNIICALSLLGLAQLVLPGCADEAVDPTPVPAAETAAPDASSTVDTLAADSVTASEPVTGPSVQEDGPTGNVPTSQRPADEPPVFVSEGVSEDCTTALDLSEIGMAITEPPFDFQWTATGELGQSNDYNPYMDSGMAPGCSLVYDAIGSEVAFRFTLEPGERIEVRYLSLPLDTVGAIYFLDSCPDATWPDYDESGMCGSAEYKSQGFCSVGNCNPLDMSLTHPEFLDGEPTGNGTYWLVLDSLEDAATGWAMDWRFVSPE